MTIEEMPEELRYLSYPHLKPKPKPIRDGEKKLMEPPPIKTGWSLVDDIREFSRIARLFLSDLWHGDRKDRHNG